MRNVRVIFCKEGQARYTSHLDLQRLMLRAIMRAELKPKCSEGFHARPKIVFGAPLSLGFAGTCEILDFAVMDDMPCSEIARRLKKQMPFGFSISRVYEQKNKVKEIAYASYQFECNCDGARWKNEAEALFAREHVMVTKTTKRGEAEADLIPMIGQLNFSVSEDGHLCGTCMLPVGNEGNLNPQYLITAMEQYLPDFHCDYTAYCRTGFFTKNLEIFE